MPSGHCLVLVLFIPWGDSRGAVAVKRFLSCSSVPVAVASAVQTGLGVALKSYNINHGNCPVLFIPSGGVQEKQWQ